MNLKFKASVLSPGLLKRKTFLGSNLRQKRNFKWVCFCEKDEKNKFENKQNLNQNNNTSSKEKSEIVLSNLKDSENNKTNFKQKANLENISSVVEEDLNQNDPLRNLTKTQRESVLKKARQDAKGDALKFMDGMFENALFYQLQNQKAQKDAKKSPPSLFWLVVLINIVVYIVWQFFGSGVSASAMESSSASSSAHENSCISSVGSELDDTFSHEILKRSHSAPGRMIEIKASSSPHSKPLTFNGTKPRGCSYGPSKNHKLVHDTIKSHRVHLKHLPRSQNPNLSSSSDNARAIGEGLSGRTSGSGHQSISARSASSIHGARMGQTGPYQLPTRAEQQGVRGSTVATQASESEPRDESNTPGMQDWIPFDGDKTRPDDQFHQTLVVPAGKNFSFPLGGWIQDETNPHLTLAQRQYAVSRNAVDINLIHADGRSNVDAANFEQSMVEGVDPIEQMRQFRTSSEINRITNNPLVNVINNVPSSGMRSMNAYQPFNCCEAFKYNMVALSQNQADVTIGFNKSNLVAAKWADRFLIRGTRYIETHQPKR